ncbi:MAG TPA: hypothetical protein DCZ92_08130 [Elusimicrobia bacterium]|nr:MAG: hypothetical protein A2016_00800 [Elusimicrobia bacterium GWF2_62_30]HBA60773.1 hypothetical protein [Elusimicrobiota bacterium]
MPKKISFLSALTALLLCAGPARGGIFPDNSFTDSARGTTSAQFLKVPASARFAALGGCGLSLKGADAFFLNPAGLSAGYGQSASASYETLLEGASRTGLVYSAGSMRGTFSAGLLYQNYGSGLETLDGAGAGDGAEFSAYDAALGAGWARTFGRTDLGVSLKYIKSKLADASGGSVAMDAGFVLRGLRDSEAELALAVRNFGPPLELGSESAPLPFELDGGLRWRFSSGVNIFLEGRLPADHAPYLALAGEWGLAASRYSGVFLRSGLNFKNYDEHGFMGVFNGGFGLKLRGLSLDYAFSPYGELGTAHRFTAGWAWGAPGGEAREAPLAPKASIAVAPFLSGTGVTDSEAEVLRGFVESELVKTGKFRAVERTGLEFVLKEEKLFSSGASGERAVAELGKMTGAKYAVFGIVARNRNGYSITVRLVDSSSSEVVRSETVSAGDEYLFKEASRVLAAAIAAE